MNQHCKMHLQSWMENRDLQFVLDEEQANQYLVKYAPKPEKSSHHMTDMICSLIPTSHTRNNPNPPDN